MLKGKNIVVLDLETLHSASDCRECFKTEQECQLVMTHDFAPLGWDNLLLLSLSVGCYWSYQESRICWFDQQSLYDTMKAFLISLPCLVTFNGLGFDAPLMGAVVDTSPVFKHDWTAYVEAHSYDILAEIWKQDPNRKYKRGLNSLDAIAQANDLGAKLMDGAQAPRDWQAGRIAKVANYCQDDVYKTKALFEMVCGGKPILRGDGQPITLPLPRGIT